jgi:RNA polymerase sigma-70 factor (ECF subfamily)
VELIVERARNGDVAAFEELAAHYLPEAYRLAAAMVGVDDARDVAQEALVTVWRELPRLRDATRFEPWLRSIVMNRARNTLRSRRRRPTVTLDAEQSARFLHDPMVDVDLRFALEAELAPLNPESRAVLALHYLLDLPLRQVAEVLGIREGTAKSRLHAGLMVLRRERETRRP